MSLREKCVNHSLNYAIAKCKRCRVPLCDKCLIQVSEGGFCSEQCISELREFQSRINNTGRTRRSRFSILGFIKSTIIAAILVAVIAGVLYFWLGTLDPGEMMDKFRQMLKLMF